MKEFDIFINNNIYPDAESIFNISLIPLEEIKNDCVFVIDTNALLLPYTTSSRSLEEVKKLFEKLKSKSQLIIPGQVAREFANNRPEKLKEIFQKLNRKRNEIQTLSMGKYPLLDGISDYQDVLKIEAKINDLFDEYRKSISVVVNTMKAWTWNDPVSKIYKDLFSKDIILDLPIDKDGILQELNRRYLHKIPPGFKDENKPDEGIGDLLIWLTILEIAKKKKHVVFVSGDEKSDWFHRSEKQALYPRFELVNEFKTNSDDKSFHIIKLFELLNLFDVDDSIIKEVEIEERLFSAKSNRANSIDIIRKAEHSIIKWLFENYSQISIIQQGTFPDIIVEHSDSTITGVEIILLSNARLLNAKIRDNFLTIEYEFSRSTFNNLITFIIIENEKILEKEVIEIVNKYRHSKLGEKYMTHVIGYLSDNFKFIELHRI